MLSPERLMIWVNVTALQLAQGKSADELGVLGAMFTQLGDTLTTMSVQKSAVEEACEAAKTSASSGKQANGVDARQATLS